MKKNLQNIIFIFLILNLFSGCQSIKDGLEGNKKSKSAEEFLIQKKNPLVMPPDYSKLPLPKSSTNSDKTKDGFDLEKKLKENSNNTKKDTNKKITGSFEKLIIEKIKKD